MNDPNAIGCENEGIVPVMMNLAPTTPAAPIMTRHGDKRRRCRSAPLENSSTPGFSERLPTATNCSAARPAILA
ncbi:MAG: hypothetical protein IPK52_19895 [Chloroflexi bacterium]|nr:hypothetical protein [Chloroflexota bacterium]